MPIGRGTARYHLNKKARTNSRGDNTLKLYIDYELTYDQFVHILTHACQWGKINLQRLHFGTCTRAELVQCVEAILKERGSNVGIKLPTHDIIFHAAARATDRRLPEFHNYGTMPMLSDQPMPPGYAASLGLEESTECDKTATTGSN
jgi:hypothetical protein